MGGQSPPTHISGRKMRRRRRRKKRRRRKRTFRVLCSWDGLVGEWVGG